MNKSINPKHEHEWCVTIWNGVGQQCVMVVMTHTQKDECLNLQAS